MGSWRAWCTCVIAITAGLLSCCSVQAANGPTLKASCDVPGFTFKANKVPSAARPALNSVVNPVNLITLPYKPSTDGSAVPKPFTNVTATVAACTADAGCGMFTSDGYIIGAYRTGPWPDNDPPLANVSTEADIIAWGPMYYCTWACCGTWVADGLVAQLLQPVPPVLPPKGSSVVNITFGDLPKDTGTYATMKSNLLNTTCAGKPSNTSIIEAVNGPKNQVNECPERCPVACCKKLAGLSQPDQEFDYRDDMERYHFSQCSVTVCEPCGFAQSAVAAASTGTYILLRGYLREKAHGSVAASPVTKANCVPTGSATTKLRGAPLC